MSSPKFKVGDKVEYIGVDSIYIEKNKIYTIDKIDSITVSQGEIVHLEGFDKYIYIFSSDLKRVSSIDVGNYYSGKIINTFSKTDPDKKEMVNHPDHYKSAKFEVIDIIEEFKLGFNLGNTIKYVLRCGKKDDAVQELEKAKWYIQREIDNLKGKK